MTDGAPPWLVGVEGEQILPLITLGARVLRVPAGPGTGKTYGLRKRVLRLLHPDGLGVDPRRLLVCAFNRVIAQDLRAEITAELEPYGLAPPVISTIHGLAGQIAGEHPRFLLPHEVEIMVYDILVTHPAVGEMFERRHRQAMRALREHEAGLENYPALAQAATAWLADHRASMVGELPRRVEAGLRGGDYAERRFDHIIIDEFQDLTETEARLAIGLRATDGHVVALGDRKQSIYAFRGNEGGGLDALPQLVGENVTDHLMDECRRCPREIVSLANEVMAIYGEPLRDVRGPGAQIHQVHFRTPEAEHQRMAQEIVRAYRAKPGAKHLVLVTRRKWGYDLREAISMSDPDVKAQTVFSEDILETWPAREAFILLSSIADPTDPVTHRDWIAYRRPDAQGKSWKAPKRHALVYQSLREDGLLTAERLRAIADADSSLLHGAGRGEVHLRAQRLQELVEALPLNEHPRTLVTAILDPDRWVTGEGTANGLARRDIERLRVETERMFDETGDELSLTEVVSRLRNRIAAREPLGQDTSPDIQIVTLWGAKGLTADYTYLVGLCDEALPGPFDAESTGLEEGEHLLEQLRLLYVSLTRSRQCLVISRPTKIRRGEVPALGLAYRRAGNRWWQDLRSCRFLADVSREALPGSIDGGRWQGIVINA